MTGEGDGHRKTRRRDLGDSARTTGPGGGADGRHGLDSKALAGALMQAREVNPRSSVVMPGNQEKAAEKIDAGLRKALAG